MSGAGRRELLARLPLARNRLAGTVLAGLGLLIALMIITVPLNAVEQLWLALGGIALFAIGNRLPGRAASLALMALSLIVSFRYVYWRATDTLEFEGPLQIFLGTGLVLAEVYAVATLAISYFQSAWPLDRRPVPLPDDVESWPTIDVFIPTYNEPLEVVKPTIFAALSMDWPPDRLNVIVLDDGRRDEFRAFCEEVGSGYMIRPDNKGAKAGNINHALGKTSGEYVVIFDCDHVATRAFLQMTVGWMLRDRGLCMVQTPHHFYSPDPFARNLASGSRVPNEGLLFYGLIQPGNDFWDATFFCGSCAVIRRTAIEQIGGVPTTTVTEDCHASLKMQKAGWRTAYLRLPLAGGLATERLILHIGQRARWTRGMLQILRTENPLFAHNLSLPQRLCYFMAMFHFLYPLSRIVFLTAPLAWLLLGENVIAASPLAIFAYAGPHIIHSTSTASRVQGRVRHSFWSEVYEAVLCLHLLPVVLMTLWNPRKGKFNVTDKGGMLESGYLDMRAIGPNLGLGMLLVLGILVGVVGLFLNPVDSREFQAFALNVFWAVLCLITILGGLAVGRERRQQRERARIRAKLEARVMLPDGRIVAGTTTDISLGGAAVDAPAPQDLPGPGEVLVALEVGPDTLTVPAEVLRWNGNRLFLRFTPRDVYDEGTLVRAVFGRADAWLDWDDHAQDRPLASFGEVVRSAAGVFRGDSKMKDPRTGSAGEPPNTGAAKMRSRSKAAAVLLSFGLVASGQALAQSRGHRAAAPAAPAAPAAAAPVTPAPIVPAEPEPVAEPAAPPPAPTREISYSLRQLGLRAPMQLRGTSDLQGVLFGVRADEVVTAGKLVLSGATSPALIPELSQIAVTLNEQFVAAIQPDRAQPSFGPVEFPMNPIFFADLNRLNFRFSGRYAVECNDPLSGLLWSTIYDSSTLQLTLEKLPQARDLARLPEPFFDPRILREALNLPVVMPPGASNDLLRGAAIATSWFAVQADYRGANFPVGSELPEKGHAMVLLSGSDSIPGLALPRFEGPTLAVVPHPGDDQSLLLVIGGRTAAEAAAAASTLAVGKQSLSGEVALVQPPVIPARQPYDAPRWIAADKPTRLGDLVDASELQAYGYAPGAVNVPFRTAPDLWTSRDRPLASDIRFRGPPGPILDLAVSRLDVSLNDLYLRSFPLASAEPGWPWAWFSRQLGHADRQRGQAGLPAWDIFGQNELQLRFDMRPLHRGDCTAVPGDIRASIDPDSTIDLSDGHHFTALPNLALFAGAGYPFTRFADLSGTAAVLPDRPQPKELSAFFGLLGRMAALTGYPVTGIKVARAQDLQEVAKEDLIVVGTLGNQAAYAQLLKDGPLRVERDRLAVALPDSLADLRYLFGGDSRRVTAERAAAQLAAPGNGLGALIGFESPLRAGRSVLALTGTTTDTMEAMTLALRDRDLSPRVQGDLVLLSDGKIEAFALGSRYTVGSLPVWLWPEYYLADSPLGLTGLLALAAVLVATPLYWVLRRRAVRRLRVRTT